MKARTDAADREFQKLLQHLTIEEKTELRELLRELVAGKASSAPTQQTE